MSVGTLARRMADAGATAELIAIAIEELEAIQGSLDARRSADRDRKRAQRERLKSADVTGHSAQCHSDVTDKGSLEVSPHTPLPKPSKSTPFSSPKIEERIEVVGSCLRKALKPVIELPDWLPSSYAEFRTMRKKMRNVPFEEGAERRCLAKLGQLRSEGHDPEKLLSKAIENGHRTFFPDETTKFSGGDRKLTTDEQIANLKKSIEFFSRNGRHDDVRECRRRIEALEGGTVSIVRAA